MQLAQDAVESGATYCSAHGAVVEKAEVLSVGSDRVGIPHVRFQLEVKRGCNTPTVEQRTLALSSFRARYRDRL